jgi:Bacterial Ig-like domain (group 3)/FG-GAP-like repeat/Abnormal spindle-like microcephaly-assoc'd, ASPM-SPD-2-Hydin
VADFNADGVLDLAVANQSSNSVSVLLGNGDGTFQAASIYVTGTVPVSVAVGDFNGDGALDLVTANRTSNTISILRGIPGGTFQNQTEYTGGTSPISVIVADVNADGKVDVVVANQNSMTVSVFLGNGDGTFQPKVDYATSTTYSYALLSGDFNGDGKVDVATVGDSNVSILFGNGDGSFQGPITVAQVPGFAEVAADFNDDGRLDLATTYAGSVAVLSQVPYGKVSPTALNFGPVLLGEASPTRLVALSNIGSSELTAPSISISGDFAISNNSCTKGVKPETHCNVDVTFTPTALGLETGALTFTDNAPNSPQTISLTGTGSNMAATTTRLTSSQSPSLYKQSVTFAATVTSAPSATITGTVSFMDGTSLLRSVALASGIAPFTTVALTPGSHSITAAYNGSSNYLSSTSAVVTQTVNPAATAATLAAAPNPSSFGETVKLTATVKSGTLPATGSVTFKNGTITLGTGTLSASGVATLNVTTLPVGTDSLTIVYPGNTDFQRSTSTAVNEVVNKAKTTTTVQSSPNPAPHGTAVTFTATIKPPFSGSSTGTVTFKDGTTTLKTVPVSAGAAKYTTSTLATGTHNITATYNGSTDFTGSSGALVQTVN